MGTRTPVNHGVDIERVFEILVYNLIDIIYSCLGIRGYTIL